MTELGHFTPGGELLCAQCSFCIGTTLDPACVIAVEMADEGETMHASCCVLAGWAA